MRSLVVTVLCAFCWTVPVLAQAPPTEKKPAQPAPQKPQPSFEKITEDPALPRVFLIGDSISMGYTIPVRKLLQGKANVLRAMENCGPTTRGIERLDKWLDVGKLDVIHFNFGLHDLYVPPETGKPRVDIKDYEENLRKIVERLKKTGAKLIWASTTAVVDGPGRKRQNKDVIAYNEAALRVIQAEGIPVDDLYSELMKNPDREKITTPEGTHFTAEGYDLLAKRVAASITEALK